VFIVARQFNQKPITWVAVMCRLAAREAPSSDSSSGTQNQCKTNAKNLGDELPAKRFLEKFQKHKNHMNKQNMCIQFILHLKKIMTQIKNNGVQLPYMVSFA